MNKFEFGNYDPTVEIDEPFFSDKGYTEPSNEQEVRKQLSSPLKEIKDYVNSTVNIKGDSAVQLKI